MKRGGRPRGRVQPAVELVTKRVQLLINLAHDGNVHEASKVSKVPSSTLRALYSGKNINPSVETLRTLGEAYGFYPGWFTDPTMPEAVPIGGLSFLVRVPNPPHGMRPVREITIPWASWPLPEVYEKLEGHLLSLPRGPGRPIIGELGTEPDQATEMSSKIAQFLIQPLDQARQISGQAMLNGHEDFSDVVIIQRLRQLGHFWQNSLGGILG